MPKMKKTASRKRSQIGRKHGFRTNNVHCYQNQTAIVVDNQAKRYVRLTKQTFDSRVTYEDSCLTLYDVDHTQNTNGVLRPNPDSPTLLDEMFDLDDSTTDVHPDLLVHKLYRPLDLQKMFNTEIRKHTVENPTCSGDLNIDAENSRKWGLGWSERLRCSKCAYVSNYYKLYEEMESNSRGRRAAAINFGLQCGLMSYSLSNNGMQFILLSAKIIPPSITAMQKQSNKVGKYVEDLNKSNMKEIREHLITENEICGNKNPKLTQIEGDCRYNNGLYNASTTPFQAGTQVTAIVAENNTTDKKIVGMFTGNKLCTKATQLRNNGLKVQCPNHEGHCTANLSEDESIGNEEKWTETVVREIQDTLNVSHFTGDGDSKSHKGVDKAQTNTGAVSHMRDTRHLAKSLKNHVYKAKFSANMFKGSNKSNLKNRFALSVRARCVAELKAAHKKYKSDMSKIKVKMPMTIQAIIFCFKGYCGHYCQKHSFVCHGNNHRSRNYLPPNYKVRMTSSDESLLHECILTFLGAESLELTKYLTNTQKSEAANKAFQTSNPKNITWVRNFPARVHHKVHSLNNGHVGSLLLKLQGAGISLPQGRKSSLLKQLRSVDRHNQAFKSKYVAKRRIQRAKSRQRKYDLHAAVHYESGMCNPLPQNLKSLSDHTYSC